jgi:uncharacterized membrane protein YqjE
MKLPLEELDLSGTAGRLGALVSETVRDRIELLGLELREDKIRLVQVLILACFGVVFALLALILGILTLLALLPPDWRVAGMGLLAAACLMGALWTFTSLRRRLGEGLHPFAQTLDELKKDRQCF